MSRMTSKPLLALAAALVIAGCTTVVHEPTRTVYHEVPAPIVETVPVASAGSSWVPGHWVWHDGGWRWAPGHFVQVVVPPMPRPLVEEIPPPPSPARYYVHGHWRWGGTAWVWVHGTWYLR